MRRWRIIEIRKKGHTIATLAAVDADAAIKAAIRDYGVTDPHRQRRLVAQRVESERLLRRFTTFADGE